MALSDASSELNQLKSKDGRYLFNPIVDFLCLGGSSLFILPVLMLIPADEYQPHLASAMLILAHFVNHPHFAHSYHLFYRDFFKKITSEDIRPELRVRYVVSGIAVPILLLGFFGFSVVSKDIQLLGFGANIMALFVGWHYVKQGYGILMLDAALKKSFFKSSTKNILLLNSYAVWIAAWLGANSSKQFKEYFGIEYYTFDFPEPVLVLANAFALIMGAIAIMALFMHFRSRGVFLLNGVTAYFVSLYAWILFLTINPLWILVVPALHSLQYLIVVWRFEINYGKSRLNEVGYETASDKKSSFKNSLASYLILFSAYGLVSGFIGFWGLPVILNILVPFDQNIFGAFLFLFIAWIFVNVHHYFIDNVIWRRDNPDAKRYLFG